MSTPSPRRVALAASVGATIEWYDFFLYGTAAGLVFDKLFFNGLDGAAAQFASFGTFAVGFLAYTSFFQRVVHYLGNSCPLRMGSGDVVCICCHSTTQYFTINFGATFFCMLQLLEDNGSCAFSRYESVTVFVERSGCC